MVYLNFSNTNKLSNADNFTLGSTSLDKKPIEENDNNEYNFPSCNWIGQDIQQSTHQ